MEDKKWLSIKEGAILAGKSTKTIRKLYRELEGAEEGKGFIQRQPFGQKDQTRIVCLEEKLLEIYPRDLSPTPPKTMEKGVERGSIEGGVETKGTSMIGDREILEILLEQLRGKDKELEIKNDQIKMLNITLNQALSKVPRLEAPKE